MPLSAHWAIIFLVCLVAREIHPRTNFKFLKRFLLSLLDSLFMIVVLELGMAELDLSIIKINFKMIEPQNVLTSIIIGGVIAYMDL